MRIGVRGFIAREWPLLLVAAAAVAVIVVAFLHFSALDATLRYGDTIAKLNMARRIADSHTPGLAQMGGVWLPLPVLLMALITWITPLYTTGLAGALLALPAYVAACVMLFALGRRLAGTAGGLCAAVLFAANPEILYVYTTPMTEPLLITAIIALALAAARFEEQPRRVARLVQLAAAALVCTLIRYEGWFLLPLTAALVVVTLWRAGAATAEIQARTVAFLALAGQGVLLWLVWETVIFRHPLYFATSVYSAHAIDVVGQGISHNVGAFWTSIATYAGAMRLTFPTWTLALLFCGLAIHIRRLRLRPAATSLAPLLLLGIPIFFVLSLYRGQAAIFIGGRPEELHYNVRYGLVAAPLVALLGGLATAAVIARLGRSRRPAVALSAAAVATLAVALFAPSWPGLRTGDLVILRDGGAARSQERLATARWLREHHDGGLILLEMFKNNDLAFYSGISQRRFISEANQRPWQAALRSPESTVQWVYISARAADPVRQLLRDDPEFHRHFDRIYHAPHGDIYRLRQEALACAPAMRDGAVVGCRPN